MTDQRLVKPLPISGFPEWLPEVRLVEMRWIDQIRTAFERYGFCNVETPSVEHLEALSAKGDTSNEIYTLRRLQAGGDDLSDARLGLHFDLTVPFARYVAQHLNDLAFPFKRYQIQRVWRGERPQEGRYREFTQCDIDVINHDHVPLIFDVELPRMIHEVLTGLVLPEWVIGINNRKVLQGFYEGLGIANPVEVIRILDKLDKIGEYEVSRLLAEEVDLGAGQIKSCLDLATIKGADTTVIEQVKELGVRSDLLTEGLAELEFVIHNLADLPTGSIVADLSIARGLDYYTGTVYEGKFIDWPGYGSICSGGRYDNLAGSFVRRHLPGIGISIGLTRIFAKVLGEGLLATGPAGPTQVLIIVPSENDTTTAMQTASVLRARGVNTEVYHEPDRLKNQLRYASRKAIPYVWFPPFGTGSDHEVKDMATGEQVAAVPATWLPGL